MKSFKEFDIKKHCKLLTEKQITPPNVSFGLNKLREELPQITDVKNFADYCKSCGTRVTLRNIMASSLKPAQSHVEFEKVIELVKNINLEELQPIAIDRDGYIIDGHHRWTAVMYINPAFRIPCYQFNIKLKNLISRKVPWYTFDNKLDELIVNLFNSPEQ